MKLNKQTSRNNATRTWITGSHWILRYVIRALEYKDNHHCLRCIDIMHKWNGYWLICCIIGKVIDGLVLHPNNEHIILPLGTTLVVRHIISRTQQFLRVSTSIQYTFNRCYYNRDTTKIFQSFKCRDQESILLRVSRRTWDFR